MLRTRRCIRGTVALRRARAMRRRFGLCLRLFNRTRNHPNSLTILPPRGRRRKPHNPTRLRNLLSRSRHRLRHPFRLLRHCHRQRSRRFLNLPLRLSSERRCGLGLLEPQLSSRSWRWSSNGAHSYYIVHEIGHQGGGEHGDGGIMEDGSPVFRSGLQPPKGNDKFEPVTIRRFRADASF